jgi:hypothetical protein
MARESTARKYDRELVVNAGWPYPTGAYALEVEDITGSGSITFQTNADGTLNSNAAISPPQGLGPAGNVANIAWDGTTLSWSYSGHTYASGHNVPAGPGQTKFKGKVNVPLIATTKNWTATK